MGPFPSIPKVLVDEPLALDLLNTNMRLGEDWMDVLDDQSDRAEWLTALAERLDVSTDDVAAFTDDVAAETRKVREYAAAAIEPARHGRKPPARALAGLNRALREAPAVPQARWEDDTVRYVTERPGSFGARLAARFSEAAVELLADEAIRRVRRCDAPACVMLFLPRNPNRRWCMPSVCGNRARVARYYLRHRPDPVDA